MAYVPPSEVISPRSFWSLFYILADGGEEGFSLALGRWAGNPVMAVRWNGSTANPLGNPQSRGLATWFVLPRELTAVVLSILSRDKAAFALTFLKSGAPKST